MKKRGFTLIELLAVIVVLAIIALIATPIVMNVIKNANKGAAERSAERYLDAVEKAIATDRLENSLIADGTYNIVDGQLEGTRLDIKVSGDYPKSGTVVIEKGQVVSSGTSMTIGDYTVTIDSTGKATATAKAEGGALVLCTAATPTEQPLYNTNTRAMDQVVVGVEATSEAPYALGAEYTCNLGDGERTFYVLKEEGDNVKLLMNENLGDTVAWSGDMDSEEPVAANEYLATQTSGWTNLTSANGTVELPSGQDIADAMGDTSWNGTSYTETRVPDWMRVNLGLNVGADGYWSSAYYHDVFSSDWDRIYGWLVGSDGKLYYDMEFSSLYYGIRPVITILKSNMSL